MIDKHVLDLIEHTRYSHSILNLLNLSKPKLNGFNLSIFASPSYRRNRRKAHEERTRRKKRK